jgi:hypothetical protein
MVGSPIQVNGLAAKRHPAHGRAVQGKLGLGIRLALVALVITCVAFFVDAIDLTKLGAAVRGATPWPLALAAVLNFACLWGKATCWHLMLAPRYEVPTHRLFRYTIAAFAASAIAPARAGEVLRLWALKRRHGVPVADAAAVAVAEKLIDAVAMLLLVAPLPWLLPDLPAWVARAIAIVAGVALALLAALYVLVGRVDPDGARGTSWLARFVAGMHVIRAPRRLALALAAMLAAWLVDLANVELVLHAVGIHAPVAGGILILFTLNLAIVVPTTPAQVGALELGAIVATDLLGIPREPAVAFALLYHFLQVIPLIVAGLALELRLVLGREALAPEA